MEKLLNRPNHLVGVAEYMACHAEEFGLVKERMFILGYLHDIGYIFGDIDHELKGACYLDFLGYKDFEIIQAHGMTPKDYTDWKNCSEDDIPKELFLLWEADLRVDIDGRMVSFEERLDGIRKRRGDFTYNKALEKVIWLKENRSKFQNK